MRHSGVEDTVVASEGPVEEEIECSEDQDDETVEVMTTFSVQGEASMVVVHCDTCQGWDGHSDQGEELD